MYNIFRILIGVPDYSSSSLFLNEEEAILPPPTNKILRVYYIGIPIHSFFFNEEEAMPPPPTNKILRAYYIGIPSTCTEDVQYI